MGSASHSQTINAEPDALWGYLGDFNGLARWHPDVKTSTLEDGGNVRRLHLHNGVEIVEWLIALEPAAHTCRYSIIGSPLPIRRHEAAISIHPASGGARVDWRCEFESAGPPDAELVPIFQQIFETGLTHLKSIMER